MQRVINDPNYLNSYLHNAVSTRPKSYERVLTGLPCGLNGLVLTFSIFNILQTFANVFERKLVP